MRADRTAPGGTVRTDGAPPASPALLVVLPPGPGVGPPPDAPLVGLPLARRVERAAALAGFARVVRPGAARPPAGAPPPAALPAGGGARVVLLAGHVLPQVDWLRRLREAPLPHAHALLEAGVAAAVDVADADALLAEAARLAALPAALGALAARFKPIEARPDAGGRFVLEGERAVARAEQWMLRGLIKDSEGFMSRHVERRLSLALTRHLARTPITPNAVTLVSLAIGFAGAPCFASPAPGWQLAGALLFLLHSILDGCDGELARLTYRQSRLGAVLDFWGDNLVHVAVFGAMALGWAAAADSRWPLYAGALAVAGTLIAAALLHRRQALPRPGDPGGAGAARLVELFAHRDFIYLIVALAWWGRAWWFLVPAAVGIPVFVLAVAWTARPRRGRDGR